MSLWSKIKSVFSSEAPTPQSLPNFAGARNRAVIVGLGNTNPRAYNGWDGNCPGALLDARNMHRLCVGMAATAVKLTDKQATRQGVKEAVAAACAEASYGDRLILFYSGHGGQRPDFNGDEADQLDETFCLWDGQAIDDLMEGLLCAIPAEMDVLLITDCCHSGSNARGIPMVDQVESLSAKFKCSLVHIAGCSDTNVSYGGNNGGVLTNALLSCYGDDVRIGTWARAAETRMPANQRPMISCYNTTRILGQTVFK